MSFHRFVSTSVCFSLMFMWHDSRPLRHRRLLTLRRQVHGNVADSAAPPAPAADEGTKVDRPTEA